MKKIIISIIVITGILVFFAVKFGNERQVWLNEHCEVIGKVSGSSAPTTGFTSSGNMTFGSTYIPGKTGYKCDDGLEYWE